MHLRVKQLEEAELVSEGSDLLDLRASEGANEIINTCNWGEVSSQVSQRSRVEKNFSKRQSKFRSSSVSSVS